MHIAVKKGLDIPIKGHPKGGIRQNIPSGEAHAVTQPSQIALMFDPFHDLRFKVLVKPGETVKIGQPLAEEKGTFGRMLVSPAGGVIDKEVRGPKRVLESIIINVSPNEEFFERNPLLLSNSSQEELIAYLLHGGAFAYIHQRPFSKLADPVKLPRAIFVKALESAPFVPPAELQVKDHEEDFLIGIEALNKICPGNVHLVHRADSTCDAFTHAKNANIHTAEGPHPVANHSVHIEAISPIQSADEIVWTVNAWETAYIGHLIRTGQPLIERILAVAGPGILDGQAGYYRGRSGYPIKSLIPGRIHKGPQRLISGDPLTGNAVSSEDFLGFYKTTLSVIPENTKREFLHFFRLGMAKYSFSKTYLTGHLNNTERTYNFTTNQHGETRAFIDSSLYDKVMPLNISTMLLVKAVMAQDFELAEQLGLLEVASEDFALPSFVCPSKIEMIQIIQQGLNQYAAEMQG